MTLISSPKRRATAGVTALALALGLAVVPADAQERAGGITHRAADLMITPGPDETSLNLSWRSSATGTEYVQIAPAGEDLESAEQVPAEQKLNSRVGQSRTATVTGLKPDTSYTYRVGSEASGWSAPVEYTTESFDGAWNFLYVGDPQIGASGDAAADGEQWRTTVDTMTSAHPDASWLLSGGDQVNVFSFDEYDEFHSPEQLRSLPTATIMGNHEVFAPQLFDEQFNMPNRAPGSARNYYFEHNNALVVALDSNVTGAQQIQNNVNYLRETVTEHGADKDWVIVTYHHAPFSQAYHYFDSDVTAQREAYAPVLSELGVDLVLSGHDHIHTRTHLMEGLEPVVPEEAAGPGDRLHPEEGQTLYLPASPSSGSKFYALAGPTRSDRHKGITREEAAEQGLPHESTAWWDQDYTPDYTNIEVDDDTLKVTTRNVEDGSLVDEFTLDHSDEPEEPGEPGDNGDGGDGGDQGGDDKPGKPGEPGADGSSGSSGSSEGGIIAAGVLGGITLFGLIGAIAAVLGHPGNLADIDARTREFLARLGLV